MFRNDYDTILTVKPGITDYASIEFRDESELLESPDTFEKRYVEEIMPAKIGLYRRYVESRSWRVDLSILIKTLSSLVRT
jgi:lipopolysaccharide/colanic/teichoic acid biosynthesis glycosyltransferase